MPKLFKKHPSEFVILIVGVFFFFNPMLSLLDLLPDFIGCALIIYALNRLSPVSSELENACTYFKYMMLTSVVRLFVTMANPGFDDVMSLSIILIFGIVEFGIAFAALSAMCDGLAFLNARFNGKTKESPEMRYVGLAFFAMRGFSAILAFLPTVIRNDEDDFITGGAPAAVSDYSSLLMLVNIVLTLIFAVFFATVLISYVGKLSRDREMRGEIALALEVKGQKEPEFFIRKTFDFSFKLIAYSPLFLIDFIGDGINYIPDALFGALSVWAVLLMGRYASGYRRVAICGGIYTAISMANFFIFNSFMKRRYFLAFFRLITNYLPEYIFAVAFTAAETVSLCIYFIMLAKFLIPIAHTHAIWDVPPEFVKMRKETDKYISVSKLLIKLLMIFGIFISLLGTLYTSLLHFFNYYNFPYIMVHLIFNIIFFAFSSTVMLRMRSGMLKRYEKPSDIV